MAAHLDEMKGRVVEVFHADPELLAWFRYGASYAICLCRMIDFYNEAGRDSEANDALTDLGMVGSSSIDAIAKNFLRLGLYWDEVDKVNDTPGDNVEERLDVIRNK